MIIALIRHGETIFQKEKRYQGITDVPLSPEGREKLHGFPELGNPGRVYVSPLGRARETASILFPEAEQTVIRDLREMNFGEFEGKNHIEMEQDARYRAWVDGMCEGRCPGGETREEYSRRVCDAFLRLLEENGSGAGGPDPGRKPFPDIVIVAHGGTQMVLLDRFCSDDKKYYEWQLPCGQGYLLRAFPEEGGIGLAVLDILE